MSDHFDQPAPSFTHNNADITSTTEVFSFSGRGAEYFRIWIVNLLLSILTLGIYSAWAKVRRQRYFYDNTRLAGSSFEYHGNPLAILKGRIITVGLLMLYQFAIRFHPPLGLLILLLFALVMPWLVWRSLQFKLFNSSYRGIRFGFRGSAAGVYQAFLLWPLLALFTFSLLTPFAHQRIKRFQHNESRFGTSHFSFNGRVGKFYLTYLTGLSFYLVGLVLLCIPLFISFLTLTTYDTHVFNGTRLIQTWLLLLGMYTWTFMMYPLFLTLLQNLIWNHTRLGQHQFHSHMRWGRMLFIVVSNMIGIVCTLGLFTPFAQIRTLRYRIESMSVQVEGGLDQFIASSEAPGSATGEGVSDLLDFDLSL
jgi:uncharacterized membrane protein YjgN (DUF898 family)